MDLAENEEGPIDQEHFDDQITPLTMAEIDQLCDRLNRQPISSIRKA